MSNSFQTEIPRARVNITLDLHTEGALRKQELPLKLMVLGDFSHRQSSKPPEPIRVSKHNFNDVLRELAPQLRLTVPNFCNREQSDMAVALTFQERQDFHPDDIALQVPAMRRLIAMRNLLKELKANLIDDRELRQRLQRIIDEPEQLQVLQKQLEELSEEDGNND
ncbi:MAG: type VI secretion system contractile sheath small subunit [Legionellales bacterium]|nr:type VI secretion system contractile sheath small subunit [Legionellales bacterium]